MRERYQERGPSLALLLSFMLAAAVVNLAVGGLMQVVVRHGAGAGLPSLEGVTQIDLIEARQQTQSQQEREDNPVPEALIALVEPMDEQRANDPKYTDAYDRQVDDEQRASRANDPSSARGQRNSPLQAGTAALPPGASQSPRPSQDPQDARPELVETSTPQAAPARTKLEPSLPERDEGAEAARPSPPKPTPTTDAPKPDTPKPEATEPERTSQPGQAPKVQVTPQSTVMVPNQSEMAASMHEVFGGGGSQQAIDGPANAPADAVSTQRHDYASFFNRIREQIVTHWDPNLAIRDAPAAELGAIYRRTRLTLLRVRIRKDGAVDRVWIDRSSGFDILDEHAVRAVRAAAPFANLPPGLQNPQDQKLVFSMEFRFTRGGQEAIRLTP